MTEIPMPDGGVNPALPGEQSLLLFLSWLWVGMPLAWGVSRTVIQSLALFQ